MADIRTDNFALAGFMLTVSAISAKIRSGETSLDEASRIISDAQWLLQHTGYPGADEIVQDAVGRLQLARDLVLALSLRPPTSRPS